MISQIQIPSTSQVNLNFSSQQKIPIFYRKNIRFPWKITTVSPPNPEVGGDVSRADFHVFFWAFFGDIEPRFHPISMAIFCCFFSWD